MNFYEISWFDDIGHVCGHAFQNICNITKVNNYFVGILNLWIALPMKNTNLTGSGSNVDSANRSPEKKGILLSKQHILH